MGASSSTSDSNITGLAIAEEVLGSPGTLPGPPIWQALEPNSYGDFGTETETVARAPITASRQKRKGILVGSNSQANFNTDFTSKVPYTLMQGFMFADWRAKRAQLTTAVSGTQYTVAANGTDFVANVLAYAEGHSTPANNGLKLVTASTATTVSVAGLTAEASPPATSQLTKVGQQYASADAVLTVAGGRAVLTLTAGTFDTLGLIPGEWVFIGGDSAATRFATAVCNGFYRVYSAASKVLTFDRAPGAPTADTGTGKTIQLFAGHIIKNEADRALQKFRTFQVERQYNTTNLEYVKGCGANELKISVKTKDKVSLDWGYVGLSGETATVAKTGTRVALPAEETVFNSATSFSRMLVLNDTASVSLATFVTDLNLTISNGIEPADAIGNTLGSIDLTAGDFTVTGDMEVYFSDVAAVNAVQANADCAVAMAMVENATTNAGASAQGWLFDIPLITMGDARLKVEKDRPVKIPLSLDAAAHERLNHTLVVQRFAYLPQLAL